MLKNFFFNLTMAALIASIPFAPEQVARIAEFLGAAYGMIVTPIMLGLGCALTFSTYFREKHAGAVVEMRETVRFLPLRRVLLRVGHVLVILAGVSVGWKDWAGWMAAGFAWMLLGMYLLGVASDKIERELIRLRASNVDLRHAIGAFRCQFWEENENAVIPMRVWIDDMLPVYQKALAESEAKT